MPSSVGSATFKLILDSTQFDKGLGNAKGKAAGLVKGLVGPAALAGAAAAAGKELAELAIKATKLATEFESSTAKIEGLVGVPGEIVEAWKPAILDLASEFGKPPKELADAMFFVTSAGLRGEQALDALRESAQASAAGLGEVATIADVVTSAMNAYQAQGITAAEVTDVLTATVREGKLEAADLAAQIGDSIPLASALGVEFDQVATAFAALSRTGTSAAKASTQVNAIFRAAIKPTADASKALDEYIGGAENFRRMLREDGLLNTLDALRDGIEETGTELSVGLGRIITDTSGLQGALDLLGDSFETNVEIQERLADAAGDTAEAFNAQRDTAELAINRIQAAWEGLLITFGSEATGPVAEVMNAIADAIDRIRQHIQNLPEGAFDGLERAASAAADAIIGIVDNMDKIIKVLEVLNTIRDIASGGPVRRLIGRALGGGGKDEGGDVPQLAKGGIVKDPTLAIIGEAGPEAVVPLDEVPEMAEGGAIGGALVMPINEIAKSIKRLSDALATRIKNMPVPGAAGAGGVVSGGRGDMSVTINASAGLIMGANSVDEFAEQIWRAIQQRIAWGY